MRRAGTSLACAAFLAGICAVGPASAQDLSEKATRAFMEYAWSLTPEAFTKPNGETIQIDKKKKDAVMIPVDVAREVIRAGRLSAHAQVCELTLEQTENHNSLMRRETVSKKWTPQQLVYINQLHLTVVMMLTGRVKLVEKGDDKGDKDVVIEEGTKQAQTCSAEQKQKVKELITAYVKTGPPAPTTAAPASTDQPPAAPPPATTASPAGPAAPMPAAQKAPPPAAQK
jgi:hypothetical protein